MPVTQLCDADTPGARDISEHWNQEPGRIFVHTTHHGLVLDDRERNGYDDSDFYAVVWNAEKGEPENIEYGTTRFWTYPAGATVDATDEVRALYESWLEARAAEARYAKAWNEAHATAQKMDDTGLTFEQVTDLSAAYIREPGIRDELFRMLKSQHAGRLRSEFRKSLAGQVRADAIEATPTKAVEVLADKKNLTPGESEGILAHLAKGGELTRYGLHAAVTRHSADVEDYDRATELETLGGDIIRLPQNDWQEIAAAA